MQYVNLGSSGIKVSRICLGTMTYGAKSWREWVLEEAESRPFIQKAWESGINFYDTADMYSLGVSEEILGRAIRELAIPRDRVVVATKLFNPMGDDPNQRGLSRKHLRHAVDASLKRLGTDYIDLYQIHRLDATTPMEEILEGLDDLVRAGKVLYVGASSMFAWQFAKLLYLADRHGWSRFVTMQNHYNLAYREEEREMNPLCVAEGVGLLPWSPLARGFLATAKRDKESTVRARTDDFAHSMYYQESDYQVVEVLTQIAESHGRPNAQIALAWMLQRPGVVAPIVGASKMKHLDDALAALDVRLSAEEISKLEAPYQPHRILGHA